MKIDDKIYINGVINIQDEDEVIEHLKNGVAVSRYEYGDSMSPLFVSGEYAILQPINSIDDVKIGDAVFCKVDGYYLTHLVWLKSNGYCLIGSSHGGLNGWTNEVYAIATKTNKIRGIDDI